MLMLLFLLGPALDARTASTPASRQGTARPASPCPRLPVQAGPVIRVTPSQSAQLRGIVGTAKRGTTILLADGTYAGMELSFRTPGVTLRSESGNRDAVIIDGLRRVRETIRIYASDVTIADLTVTRAFHHLIHLGGGGHRARLYNLRLLDGRQHFVKVNPDRNRYNDEGTVACSQFEMTATGREFLEANPTPGSKCYTGGIDAHQAVGWVVRDNIFRNFYCTNRGLADGAIFFWAGSRDTVVERNVLINNARNILFGLSVSRSYRVYSDDPLAGSGFAASDAMHIGGTIKNNVVYADIAQFDTGIGLEKAWNARVYHNTVYSERRGLAIDVRFRSSNAVVKNNLVRPGVSTRDGAIIREQAGNIPASSAMFVKPAAGDLHLAPGAGAVDRGVALGDAVPDDIDGERRDARPDAGADELRAARRDK